MNIIDPANHPANAPGFGAGPTRQNYTPDPSQPVNDPILYRPSYHSGDIRAATLAADDVVLFNGSWRRVLEVYRPDDLADALANRPMDERVRELFTKHLTEPDHWVLVVFQWEKDASEKYLQDPQPIRYYDLVTIQVAAAPVRRP